MIKKIILENQEARSKILKGALTVSRILGRTLGPSGRNVMIQKAYSAPEITNDGGTIARHIVIDDPVEDLGAQTIVESTMKTNDRGGDGRSTTAVLAGTIIETCSKKIKAEDGKKGAEALTGQEGGADVIGMARDIMTQKDIVIEKLRAGSRLLKKGELKNVVSTSIGKIYPEYVQTVADMVDKVGVDGYVSVEDNWGTKYGVESNTILGMRFLGSYISPVMITDLKKKESVLEDSLILVTNHRLDSTIEIGDLIKELRDSKVRKIIIIAEGFEKDFIMQVASSYINNAQMIMKGQGSDFFKCLAIKAPSLTTEQFEDIAVFCDAKFINKNLGGDITQVKSGDLGFAKKIVVDENDTIITGGRGKVEERLKLLNAELETEKDSAFKEQLKRRIGALTSGFGIIRVGASTESERMYVKKKIEDSVNAAKAALEEGIVKGGGLALAEIAKELGKDNILYEALLAPQRTICSNAGVTDMKIPSTIIDALKVTRLAVENACSVASGLITCEVAIGEKRRTFSDELDEKIAPSGDEDFRLDENQELKYRT